MKRLKIAQIAPPFFKVPPQTYGGTEAVVSNITEELVKRGHDVTLFASGDSKTKAKLVSAFPRPLQYEELEKFLSPLAQQLHWMYSLPLFYHTVKAFEEAQNFDIIHDHTHYLSLFFAPLTKAKTVFTYHGSFSLAEESPIEKLLLEKYKDLNWTAISVSQKNESTIPINFVKTIYHGLHIDEYTYTNTPENYIAWLGRITDRKGIVEAITVAKKLKKTLVITGVVKQRDEAFFLKEVKPFINGTDVQYRGAADVHEKVKILQNAKLLLYPVKWEEPFGMVMIEAMAVGTPVIGFDRGSVPEIIKQDETGFVVKNVDEMIEKTKQIYALSESEYTKLRQNARRRVETHFTVEKMVDRYEELYTQLLEK